MSKDKYYANKGVARNKKPLQNIIIKTKLVELPEGFNLDDYVDFKFKDLGYITYSKKLERSNINNWYGLIKPTDLKELLGEKQWSKFCQGKREFIIQRRENNKNK